MKLADGGFRPAYNVQFATDGDSTAVVGVAVTNVGTDAAEAVPMLAQVERRRGRAPTTLLMDRGVGTNEAITEAAAHGVTVYTPVPRARGVRDLTARCPHDSEAVAAWRVRMATEPAQTIYRQRGADCGADQWRRAHPSHTGPRQSPRLAQSALLCTVGRVGAEHDARLGDRPPCDDLRS